MIASLARTLVWAALAVPALAIATHDTYVSTPMGRMRSDCVHHVPSDSSVTEAQNHPVANTLAVHSKAGDFLRHIPPCAEQDARPLFEHTLAQRQRQRVVLKEDDNAAVSIRVGDDPFPPDYDGWEAYTAFYNAAGFDTFLGNFSVPDAPAGAPDILYIFTGLQNVDWIPKRDKEVPGFDIIQPVLQYTYDGWAVKSWYVTLDNGALYSDELAVSAGDVIFGNMTQTDFSSGAWFIGSLSQQTGKSTNLNVARPRLQAQPWAYNTLECYGCTDCSTYPTQPCAFSGLQLSLAGRNIAPQWKLNPKPNPDHKCAEDIKIISQQRQNIVFQKA